MGVLNVNGLKQTESQWRGKLLKSSAGIRKGFGGKHIIFPSPTLVLSFYFSHKFKIVLSNKWIYYKKNPTNSLCESTEAETDVGKVFTNGGQIISCTMSNTESWACMGKSSNKEAES